MVAHKREQEKLRIKKEEERHRQKDFNPISGLTKNSSSIKLVEKHGDDLKKMHMYHLEAQNNLGAKDRLEKYTVPSNATEGINKDYAEMHIEIEGMVGKLESKVRDDGYKFLVEFEDSLRKLHARYRELENKNA